MLYNSIYEILDNIIQSGNLFISLILCFFSFITLLTTIIAIFYAIKEYKLNLERKVEENRPFVFLDIDLKWTINLELKNIGNSPAYNIQTSFHPNIQIYDDKKINELDFMRSLKFLGTEKSIKFFLGTFQEDKYLREFKINFTYEDVDGNTYEHSQELDLRNYVEIRKTHERDQNDIYKQLKEIAKYTKNISRSHKKLIDGWKNGLIIRNIDLKDYSLEEKLNLLMNIVQKGNKEDQWLNPFIYDLKHLINSIRKDIMKDKDILENDNNLILKLNFLSKYSFSLGGNEQFENTLNEVADLIETNLNNGKNE